MQLRPLFFLTDFVREKIFKIDLKREQEIEKLDKYYSEMIAQQMTFEAQCTETLARNDIPQESLVSMKTEIEDGAAALNSLRKNDDRYKTILAEIVAQQRLLLDRKTSTLQD